MIFFIGGLVTETNTFAPFPTAMPAFQEYGIDRDTSVNELSPANGPLRAYRERAEADGHDVIESVTCIAQPSGRIVRATYEELRDLLVDDLRSAGAVDVVLLFLHGAMAADGYDDCEGDLASRVREIVPDAIIGLELDPHCHLTQCMMETADIIIPLKEYPHIDYVERAHELYELCHRTAKNEIRPVAALVDTQMVGYYPTFEPPMQDIVAELRAIEVAPILSASIVHGFPWGDVRESGTRVLVYSDAARELAGESALQIAERLYRERMALLPKMRDVEEALDQAKGANGLVVLGDFADNPGGGAPGDSTFFLKAMLDRNVTDAVIGTFWDPMVVKLCADAGVGAKLDIRLGGKAGPMSGEPLDIHVEVKGVAEEHYSGFFGQRQPMGRSVWLHSDGIDIAVCSVRTQTIDRDAFTGLGINLKDARLIVVKSSNHFQAGFQDAAEHLWRVATPGALRLDFAALPYKMRDEHYFPRIADPWAASGPPKPRFFEKQRRLNG